MGPAVATLTRIRQRQSWKLLTDIITVMKEELIWSVVGILTWMKAGKM